MADIKIKFNDSTKEFKLKITLGFWKNLSFSGEDFGSVSTDMNRFIECIELAIYYGNKYDEGWGSLKAMRELLDVKNLIEEIETQEEATELYKKLFEATDQYMPKVEEKKGEKKEGDGEVKKK